MSIIASSDLQRVKDSINIIDEIDQFVSLKKQGKNYFGYCPFHDEKTPSFSVAPDKQIYKCFSCGRSGDIFSFYMEKDGLTLSEAVVKLANDHHIAITYDDNELVNKPLTKEELQRNRLIDMHEQAAQLYHYILLHTKEGEQALAYVMNRGLTRETIERYQIGVSLNHRQMLSELFQDKDFSTEEFELSGLFTNYQGQFNDRFVDRIMVPLRDEKGRVVAFSGRVYKPDIPTEDTDFKQPKYLNSPETVLFQKSTFLFNLDLARGNIRKQKEVLLCEGYMDVIATDQAGILNAVASMGTSLTEQQINKLKRLTQNVVIAYDGDDAGQKAIDRSIKLFKNERVFTISVVPLMDNMDPDDMIKQYGATYFVNHVTHHRETVFEFYQRFYKKQFQFQNQKDTLDYIDLLLQELVHEKNVTARSLHLNQLASTYHISQTALEEQLAIFEKRQKKIAQTTLAYQKELDGYAFEVQTTSKKTKQEYVEWAILSRLLTSEATEMWLFQKEPDFYFENESYQTLLLLFIGYRQHHQGDLHHFSNVLQDGELKTIYSQIQLSALESPVSEQEVDDLLARLQHVRNEAKKQRIITQIDEAKKAADNDKVTALLAQLIALK